MDQNDQSFFARLAHHCRYASAGMVRAVARPAHVAAPILVVDGVLDIPGYYAFDLCITWPGVLSADNVTAGIRPDSAVCCAYPVRLSVTGDSVVPPRRAGGHEPEYYVFAVFFLHIHRRTKCFINQRPWHLAAFSPPVDYGGVAWRDVSLDHPEQRCLPPKAI